MRLYFADGESWLAALDHLTDIHVLFSYYYVRKKFDMLMAFARPRRWKIFLDSGAYSAMTTGAAIDRDAYTDFCLQYQQDLEVVCSLDVIGDWRGSLENFRYMRSRGVNCVPVFHVNEPFDALKTLAAESDYIGLGVAGQQARRQAVGAWVLKCFKIARAVRPDVRFHGFALTSFEIMRDFDWYSVDSTSWINASKYGEICLRGPDNITRLRLGAKYTERAVELINKSLTRPPNYRALFVPRHATVEQYLPLYKHNVQCYIDAADAITRSRTHV